MNGDLRETEAKQKLVEVFRDSVDDIPELPPNHELQRWITATSGDLRVSETMFRKSVQWRLNQRVDDLISWRPGDVIRDHYPGGLAGHDDDNCPVWIIPFGKADVKGILQSASKEDFVDFTIKIVETSLQLMRIKSSENSSAPVTQHVFIFDLQGFSLQAATHTETMDILRKLISVYEKNYPETLKAAYVINASNIFQLVFRVVQTLVQQRTLSKIKIFGSENWPTIVQKMVSSPKYDICAGGAVPPQDYFKHDNISKNRVVIEPGKKVLIEINCSHTCQLSWMFTSEGGDVSFRLLAAGDSGEEVLLSRVRVTGLQSGHMLCSPDIKYFLEFDNTYSLLRSKTVLYKYSLENILDSATEDTNISEERLMKSIRGGIGFQ